MAGPLAPMNSGPSRDVAAQESAGQLSPQEQGAGMNRVLFLLGLSVLINYIDRSNLSIAAPLLKDELGLSASQLGTLLSAFFWTYGFMQIPAGWLVDRFDVKWVFAAGFFLWSAATATTAMLNGFAALIAIRIILGVGESVAFPSYAKILSSHFTESRRGFANSAIMAGLALGPAVGMLVGGTVVGRFGWRPFFLVLGLGSLLWLVPWLAWMPRGTAASAPASGTKVRIPDILRQRSAWGTCVGQFCINYTLYFLVTWLPFYLVRGRNLSMDQMAKVGGLVFLLNVSCGHRVREGLGPVDPGRSVCDESAEDHDWSGADRLGSLSGVDRGGTGQHFRMGIGTGRHLPGHERGKLLGGYADRGWPPGRGTLGWRAEFYREPGGGGCARAHWIFTGPDGAVLLAICDCGGSLLHWNIELGVWGGSGGTRGLGKEDGQIGVWYRRLSGDGRSAAVIHFPS